MEGGGEWQARDRQAEKALTHSGLYPHNGAFFLRKSGRVAECVCLENRRP